MIDKNSRTWEAVEKYVKERREKLQDSLCGGSVKHDPGVDDEYRARLGELKRLMESLTKPEKHNE